MKYTSKDRAEVANCDRIWQNPPYGIFLKNRDRYADC